MPRFWAWILRVSGVTAILLSSDAYEDQMWDQARAMVSSAEDVFRTYGGAE